MKKISLVILLVYCFNAQSYAQSIPDSVYYNRLYYTAKVWGFLKYFHSEVATGSIDWDAALLDALSSLKNDISDEEFNQTLLQLIETAGEMAESPDELPVVPDSLRFNLQLDWLSNPLFSEDVIHQLDTVRIRFRPQSNYYVGEVWDGGNPSFDTDDQFYSWGTNSYPDEGTRLLALFRYWSIINYFSPYKNIIDQDWDSTLVEFIPQIVTAGNAQDFHLAFMELATRLNDSHAVTYSSIINSDIVGSFYLPLTLKFIENETVITGVYTNNTTITVGDIIKSIDGVDIQTIRNNLRSYTQGSNNAVIERNINTRILRGQLGSVQLSLESAEGQKVGSLYRDISITAYSDLIANQGPIWKLIDTDSGKYGYVDMGRLEISHIDQMFSDVWETDGLIIDIRNYPNGTMWDMVKYLFDAPIHIANFTVPNINYPGTLYWFEEYVGQGDFSQTYDKPIYILFDETTQSQAEYTVMAFEQHPLAVKIGSQTAAADGNVSNIYLPGGIITYFTGLGTFYPDYTPTQRIGIVPDIEVHPTIAAIREGRDELLETAIPYMISSLKESISTDQIPIMTTHLEQNQPNPFNPVTTFSYRLPVSSQVQLTVYNQLGQKVATLVSERKPAGEYHVIFDGRNLASGIYFYRLVTGSFKKIRRMVLVK